MLIFMTLIVKRKMDEMIEKEAEAENELAEATFLETSSESLLPKPANNSIN
jgi:hypothetical protein